MRTKLWVAILGISLVVLPGCANGPCRQFSRGGACNSCFPWLGRGQKDKCADEYDGVSYPGDADCPNCVNGTMIDGQAPAGEFIIPGTNSQLNTDPYSGTPMVPGNDGLNSGALPRPR